MPRAVSIVDKTHNPCWKNLTNPERLAKLERRLISRALGKVVFCELFASLGRMSI